MKVAAFIDELQHFINLKPSYLSTCKWAISPSDQVTYINEFMKYTFSVLNMVMIMRCGLINEVMKYTLSCVWDLLDMVTIMRWSC